MDKEIKDIFYDGRNKDGNLLRKGMDISEHRFAVLLPSDTQNSVAINKHLHLAYKDAVMRFLIEELGGATNYNAEGYYKDKKGKIHQEKVIVCESFINHDKIKAKAVLFRALCNFLCIELDQDSISGVIDGEMVFFDPEPSYRTQPQADWHPDTNNIIHIRDTYFIPALDRASTFHDDLSIELKSKEIKAF